MHEGGTAELRADARVIHVFDPASGRNLSLDEDGEGPATLSAPPAP